MRYSKQREAVYNVLCATNTHPQAADIYREVRKTLPNISLGTVYRNLNELCESGRVKRIAVETSAERFDAQTCNHAHFVCNVCGKVFDVEDPQVNCLCSCGAVRRAEVTLYGVCNQCNHANQKTNQKEKQL